MTRTGTEQQNQRMAALSVGLLALGLALASGPVRAEPSATAAWAFDLLARAEQWRPTMPLDFLPGAAKDRPLASAAQARIQAGYGRLSMHFEPNLGQTADEVKFMARGSGYTLFLTADESVLALHPNRPAADRADPHHRRPFGVEAVTPDIAPAVLGAVIRTRLEGATRNPEPQLEGLEKQPGISNYFLGNDPAKWRTNIPHYQRVRYPNVYPGIDLVYYGNPQRLEHDFIVAPGADPTVIQLAISGAEQATVNAEGDLVLKVAGGEVVQQAPKIYQVFDGQQQEVTGRYVLRDAVPGAMPTVSVAAEPTSSPLLIGFEVAQYDRKQPLVIDPVLVYSTYLGGSNKEWGRSIAVDGSGNAYVTGATYSTDFPTVNAKYPHLWGLDDAFVFKLSSDGQTVLYSTYLGGSYVDGGSSIAVDGSGNAYVMGITYSTDFPTVNAKYPHLWGAQDAFITKIADGGSPSVTLTVSVTGSGTVYSTPGGINCGSDCSESYAPETSIMLAATAASGYVFSGWGGACIGITTNYCTLTMEADKSVAAEFKTKTPEQTDPDRSTLGITCSTTDCSTTSTKAVLITHGYNATASDWIEDMAQAICRRLPATQYYSTRKADSLMSICSGNGWDVWTTDWRTMAFATSLLPPNAYVNAGIVGPQIGNLLKNFHYQYYHLIAHSAGSNLIQTATSVLAPFATIHETFLDAFDPFALLPASDHRHISEYYGTLATYVDNYVDTRTLLEGHLDTTDLHLANGYNIDVTPAGDGCGALGISCRHGRPYRFYLKSISENTYNDPYKDVDPVDKTGQMGFALSMEAGNSMNLLKNDKDAECRMDDSGNCSPVAKPTYGTLYYLPGAIGNTLVDTAVGTVNFAKGVGAKIFETLQFAVSVPPANSITVSGEAPAIAAMPTATPAWLVTQVTTTNSTNTLRFNWRFTSGGEGLLRVFVNENLVSQIDQRFVPLASTQPESVYVGELPAGTYRIAFRLDGYGANASGMTLTDVELGQRTFNSGGQASSGVFRAGTWYLDANGNGAWDGCGVDRCYVGSFGITGDLPVAGDWNGDGKAKVGVFRNGTWYLDYNGNGAWDGCGMERCYVGSFGITGDLPVAGDWNGDGKAKVGVFRNGTWYLDYNGNGAWDGCSIDRCYVGSFGIAGDLPAAGDWNGDGKTKIGVFRNGTWYLDYNGNGAWDGCGVDRCYVGSFGQTGDLPAAGDWNGDGKAKVGVFRNGTWFLDYNGNGAWDGCGVDRCYYGSFGQQGDLPVAGKW